MTPEARASLVQKCVDLIAQAHGGEAHEDDELHVNIVLDAALPIIRDAVDRQLLDPDMPAQELRLHMGEMTAQEMRTARAAIRWANSRLHAPPADGGGDGV